jgi:hypothetical protein
MKKPLISLLLICAVTAQGQNKDSGQFIPFDSTKMIFGRNATGTTTGYKIKIHPVCCVSLDTIDIFPYMSYFKRTIDTSFFCGIYLDTIKLQIPPFQVKPNVKEFYPVMIGNKSAYVDSAGNLVVNDSAATIKILLAHVLKCYE